MDASLIAFSLEYMLLPTSYQIFNSTGLRLIFKDNFKCEDGKPV